METRARLMFVDAGFPEPEVNAPLTDAAGEWLAEGDLVWRRQRLVGEYQGEHHADRHRRSADAFRQSLVEGHGWRVKELWAEDLHRGPRRRWTLTVRHGPRPRPGDPAHRLIGRPVPSRVDNTPSAPHPARRVL